MSTKTECKPLFSKALLGQHTLIHNYQRTLSTYQEQLEHNLTLILKQHPALDKEKVQKLLEQLDNNRELALQILEEEENRCNSILEEKKGEVVRGPVLSVEQQNRILKQSFLNLYKKYLALGTRSEEVEKKNEQLRGENDLLREMNRVLLSRQYNESMREGTDPIC